MNLNCLHSACADQQQHITNALSGTHSANQQKMEALHRRVEQLTMEREALESAAAGGNERAGGATESQSDAERK